MKRAKFIQHLNHNGCGFVKHGAKHDKYMNRNNGKRTLLPRHAEIDNDLCELICKQLDIPKPVTS
jgi:predicted RNA binding protein YcfA (HicA-like mRNA interferase family)